MPFCRCKTAVFMLMILIYSTSFLLSGTGHARAALSEPAIQAKSALLMDCYSGRVLYEKNGYEQLPPASVTKIMTALLVAENGGLDEIVEISSTAANTRESGIYLQAGERMTRLQLLYACMLPSANDAAVALAESVSGSVEGFVELMNKRATELGMHDSHFCNPHGLHQKDHYTTAYDLALLARAALQNSTLREVVGTQNIVIPGPPGEEDRSIWNQNRLLYRYENALGIKTGYTREAGNCVVGAAERDEMPLIAVSLNSSAVYDDLMGMMDYGFAQYQVVSLDDSEKPLLVKVIGGEDKNVIAQPAEEIRIAVTAEEIQQLSCRFLPVAEVRAPVREGDLLGVCQVYLHGQDIASINLIAAASIEAKPSLIKSMAAWSLSLSKWAIMILLLYLLLKNTKVQEMLKSTLRFMVLKIIRKPPPRNRSTRNRHF